MYSLEESSLLPRQQLATINESRAHGQILVGKKAKPDRREKRGFLFIALRDKQQATLRTSHNLVPTLKLQGRPASHDHSLAGKAFPTRNRLNIWFF